MTITEFQNISLKVPDICIQILHLNVQLFIKFMSVYPSLILLCKMIDMAHNTHRTAYAPEIKNIYFTLFYIF